MDVLLLNNFNKKQAALMRLSMGRRRYTCSKELEMKEGVTRERITSKNGSLTVRKVTKIVCIQSENLKWEGG